MPDALPNGGVHDDDAFFLHFINHHEMMQPLFNDHMGDGRQRNLVEAAGIAPHPLGRKAQFFSRLQQSQDIGSFLVGAGHLANPGNGQLQFVKSRYRAEAGGAAVGDIMLFDIGFHSSKFVAGQGECHPAAYGYPNFGFNQWSILSYNN